MRLWHKDIIKFLPKSQLIAQWRELNSIYKKQDNHILINYIYDYPKIYLYSYSQVIIKEMSKRGYKINKWNNYECYFSNIDKSDKEYIETFSYDEHNNEYFKICYYNLYEKYLRGQKDFTDEIWKDLCEYKDKHMV